MKFKIKEKVTTFRKVATLVENAVKSNQSFAALRGGVTVLSEDLTGICAQQNRPTRAEIHVTVESLELD